MHLERTYPSGAEEWSCPACGRWVVMRHQPEHGKLKIVVLNEGDESVLHHGSHGPLSFDSAQVKPAERTVPRREHGHLH
ncbi:MAG: hypothetical protein HY778_03720 [Betaproteobacteria bacterium]|nr:hypothetical protein [Betaproteobacteria bacterium]